MHAIDFIETRLEPHHPQAEQGVAKLSRSWKSSYQFIATSGAERSDDKCGVASQIAPLNQ
jgi:hypothetical protein